MGVMASTYQLLYMYLQAAHRTEDRGYRSKWHNARCVTREFSTAGLLRSAVNAISSFSHLPKHSSNSS